VTVIVYGFEFIILLFNNLFNDFRLIHQLKIMVLLGY